MKLNKSHGLSSIIILDGGFRDMKEDLENKGCKVSMSALKSKHAKLTTKELNESRLVAKSDLFTVHKNHRYFMVTWHQSFCTFNSTTF